MIFIYSETDVLIELFDTALEFKNYIKNHLKELIESENNPELNINYDDFSEMYEIFTNGCGYKVKFRS